VAGALSERGPKPSVPIAQSVAGAGIDVTADVGVERAGSDASAMPSLSSSVSVQSAVASESVSVSATLQPTGRSRLQGIADRRRRRRNCRRIPVGSVVGRCTIREGTEPSVRAPVVAGSVSASPQMSGLSEPNPTASATPSLSSSVSVAVGRPSESVSVSGDATAALARGGLERSAGRLSPASQLPSASRRSCWRGVVARAQSRQCRWRSRRRCRCPSPQTSGFTRQDQWHPRCPSLSSSVSVQSAVPSESVSSVCYAAAPH